MFVFSHLNTSSRWYSLLKMAASTRMRALCSHFNGTQSYQSRSVTNTQRFCGSDKHWQNVEIRPPPSGCEVYYTVLLTHEAVGFVADLIRSFDVEVDKILSERKQRRWAFEQTQQLPNFLQTSSDICQGDWQVSPAPRRLCCRHVDLGDVSPSNIGHFTAALQTSAQGIQTDFDDGHCPSWRNQLAGLYNVYRAVHNLIPGVPCIENAPVLMLRPRAWNMVEHNMRVDGREVPGALFDFGLLMYHNALSLDKCESGPFFYLPKLEDHREARLWNKIMTWVEKKLNMRIGSTKACVLVENILASFQLDEILYELRDHCAGLNCGIWDYSASFVNKFANRPDFVLPDRSKYVSMEKHFLKSYMDLVIQTCHKRGAYATGGMAALLLPHGDQQQHDKVIERVIKAKSREISAGVDGFLVYDLGLVQPAQKLFAKLTQGEHQLHVKRLEVKVNANDLLLMPSGGVTMIGLQHNIAVGILFVSAWLHGQGHYFYKGAVEDSATAEISRSQVWQWIRRGIRLEDSGHEVITYKLVDQLTSQFLKSSAKFSNRHMATAARLFMEIVSRRDFPEFITTYLNEEHIVLREHAL